MKKSIVLLSFAFAIIGCKNSSETEKDNNSEVEYNRVESNYNQSNVEENVQTRTTMSKSESDRKLIEICKNMDGVVDADIKDDKLSLRANISRIEAQKLSDGMLKEIGKYNQDIKTVIIFDLDYDLVGYSGK